MSQYSQNKIIRRRTKKIEVGSVEVGGDAKISVQSMTNTLTSDANATIKQINECTNELINERGKLTTTTMIAQSIDR